MWSFELRDALEKKMQLKFGFRPKGGGGGSEANQKFWDTFCEPTFLDFLVERGRGFDQIQKVWDTFCQNMG